MLVFLYLEGPYTRGVFRRSAGAKACRELRDRLDSGTEDPEISHQSVFVIAAVLKVTHSKPHTHTVQPHTALTRSTGLKPDNRKQQRLMCVQSHRSPDRIICLCTARQAASHTHTRCSLFSIQARKPPQRRASREHLRCFRFIQS